MRELAGETVRPDDAVTGRGARSVSSRIQVNSNVNTLTKYIIIVSFSEIFTAILCCMNRINQSINQFLFDYSLLQ